MKDAASRGPFEEVVPVRKSGWFMLGVAGGIIVAHLVNKDPRGHELLNQVDARIAEFTDRMSDAYRDQEAQFGDGPPQLSAGQSASLPSISASAPSATPHTD